MIICKGGRYREVAPILFMWWCIVVGGGCVSVGYVVCPPKKTIEDISLQNALLSKN